MKRYILLVEDNIDDQILAQRALRRVPELEIDLKIAQDGQEALDYLKTLNGNVPALVVLDLKMPKVGGHELLRAIRSRAGLAAVPVVIFSSSDEPHDMREAKRCGATEYVQKPVHFERYVDTVTRLVQDYVGRSPESTIASRIRTESGD